MSAQMKLIEPRKPQRQSLSFEQKLNLVRWLELNATGELTIEDAAKRASESLNFPVTVSNVQHVAKAAHAIFASRPRKSTTRNGNHRGAKPSAASTVILAKEIKRIQDELGLAQSDELKAILCHRPLPPAGF